MIKNIFLSITIISICLFAWDYKTKTESNKYAIEKCRTANNKLRGIVNASSTKAEHENCQCVINSMNSERKILSSFIPKKYKNQKTVKQHYIKCSRELYFATMKPTIRYIGKDGFQMNDKQADIFAECFTRKKYDYELNDFSETEPSAIKTSETERDIVRNIVNTCIKLSLGENNE